MSAARKSAARGGRGGGWTYDTHDKKLNQFPGDGGGTHHVNVIEAVRSGEPGKLRANMRDGHLSAALCHMANISDRLGRRQSVQDTHAAVANHEWLSRDYWEPFVVPDRV